MALYRCAVFQVEIRREHISRDNDRKTALPWWGGRLAAAGVDSPELCSPSCLLWSPVWLSSSVTASPSSPPRPARSLSTEDRRRETDSTFGQGESVAAINGVLKEHKYLGRERCSKRFIQMTANKCDWAFVYSSVVWYHYYFTCNSAGGQVINQKRAAVLFQLFFFDDKTSVFKCQVPAIDWALSK